MRARLSAVQRADDWAPLGGSGSPWALWDTCHIRRGGGRSPVLRRWGRRARAFGVLRVPEMRFKDLGALKNRV